MYTIQVFRKIYKSTSKFILIIKMYVFIYEAPNMSTETLQFPLDIPKYLLPSLPIVKLPCNEKPPLTDKSCTFSG